MGSLSQWSKGLLSCFKPFSTVITQREQPLSFLKFKVALRNFENTEKIHDENHSSVVNIGNVKKRFEPNSNSHRRPWSNDDKLRPIPRSSNSLWRDFCKNTSHDTRYCRKLKSRDSPRTQQRWCEICKNPSHDANYCTKNPKKC